MIRHPTRWQDDQWKETCVNLYDCRGLERAKDLFWTEWKGHKFLINKETADEMMMLYKLENGKDYVFDEDMK